ncbi:MAG: beta-galactosidase [Planctomycetota bacterium]
MVTNGIDPQYAQRARAARAALNDSPLQRRLRHEAPHSVGMVYWNPQHESADTLRCEFRRIARLGFGFVRLHCIGPVEREEGVYDFSYLDQRLAAAAAAGLSVYPHFELAEPSPAALARHGLDREAAARLGLEDERVHAAVAVRVRAIVEHCRAHPAMRGGAWPIGGEPPPQRLAIADAVDAERFGAWLRMRYPTPQAVHAAWCIYPAVDDQLRLHASARALLHVASWEDAVRIAAAIPPGEAGQALAVTALKHEVFGVQRDIIRFRADQLIAQHELLTAMIRESDTEHPVIVGHHQLLYNHPQLGWDVAGAARVADGHYTSIHPSWHFEPVKGELYRPLYMQARMTNDAFKGGFSSAYETVGGPVQYSGGYGNHMDPALMRTLMLSYLAAGNESIAFWLWRARPGGIEAGEYAMTTYSGALSSWAEAAGAVARCMRDWRSELWQAASEPELGILRSWDTEMCTSLEPGRHDLRDGPTGYSSGPGQQHIRALIGAQRAAIDHQICYQVLDEHELCAGIAGAYPAICLPHVRNLSQEALAALLEYVTHGGRLIADVQIAFEDPWAKLRAPGTGGIVERIFGGWIDMIHDARTCDQRVDDIAITGFYGDLTTTRARVVKRFADGRPAISSCVTGRGEAVLVGFDLARMCWDPDRPACERLLAQLCRGAARAPWTSDLPLTWRRSCPAADHFFLVNDAAVPRTANIRVHDRRYRAGRDLLAGAALDPTMPLAITVAPGDAAWIRLERGTQPAP